MKHLKYHNVGTVTKFNRTILTHKYMTTHFTARVPYGYFEIIT